MQWRNWSIKLSPKGLLRLALSVGFVFILCVGASIVALHDAADRQLRGEAVLLRLRANLAQLSVIEYHWRVSGGIDLGLDSRAGEGSAEEKFVSLVDSIVTDTQFVQALSGKTHHQRLLLPAMESYVKAVKKLRSLYVSKDTALAFAYDDKVVDNGYTAFNEQLDAVEEEVRRQSMTARTIASVGTLAALILQFCILAFATHRLSATREKGIALSAQRKALELSERRLSVLIGNVNAVVSVAGPDGEFTYTSPQTQSIFGFQPRSLSDLLGHCETQDSVQDILAKGQDSECEVRLDLASGARDFLLQSRPLFEDPAVQGQVLVWHDITLHKQAQGAIEEARDTALNLSKLKSEFLANMSHEIRTPMNGVLGMVDLLLDTEQTPTQADYTETIRSCGTALMSLLNDILDFSKLESGRLILEEIAFDPTQVAEESADLVRATTSKNGVELIVDLQEVEWIKGDPTRLRQVILNLLSNAVKFTLEGEVVVRVTCVDKEAGRTRLRFSVKDSGIGIPAEKQSEIFGAFTQVDGSTTRIYGGTGLGLSISRQIVAMMGGELAVSSEVGKGSEFYFEIEAEIAEAGQRHSQPNSIQGIHVLVVDDSETNRAVLSGLLRRWGCNVSEAEGASQAWDQVRRSPYDLIVLDNLMPETNGTTLAREFKMAGMTTPLVLLTSVGAPLDLAELKEIGIRQCLSKPPRRPDLLQALSQAIQPALEVQQAEKAQTSGAGLRVLVVEDNRVNQVVAKKLLNKLGCSVDVASGGVEAIELLREDSYDVVFMDCLMPDMDGYETTLQLRSSPEPWKKSIPIIALTASAMEGDREKCIASGMDDYVAKPVNLLALESALSRCMARRAA